MKISTDIQSKMCPGCGGCCINVAPQFGTSKYNSKEALEKFAQEVDESFEISVILCLAHISIYRDLKYDTPEKLEKAANLLEDFEKFAQEVDESFEISVILCLAHISIYRDLKYDTPEKLEKAANLLEDY